MSHRIYSPFYDFGFDFGVNTGTPTQVTFGPGGMPDNVTGSNNIYTRSTTLVDITTSGAGGFDSKSAAPITATTSASTSIVFSADIKTTLGLNKSLATSTGTAITYSTVGTTATLSAVPRYGQLFVGDMIGDAANGFSRITAVDATGLIYTLVAALPGGNAAAGTTPITSRGFLTVQPAAVATDQLFLNTLTGNGITGVLNAATTSNAAGVTVTVGVPAAGIQYPVYAIPVITPTVSVTLSTQRESPYLTSIHNGPACVLMTTIDGSGGTATLLASSGTTYGNGVKRWSYQGQIGVDNTKPVNNFTATALTAFSTLNFPGATHVDLNSTYATVNTVSALLNGSFYFSAPEDFGFAGQQNRFIQGTAGAPTQSVKHRVPVTFRQAIQVANTPPGPGAAPGLNAFVEGFEYKTDWFKGTF